MKYILAVLLMVGVVSAADLTATLVGTSLFNISNCRMQGDANRFTVDVGIQNPSSTKFMRVTYLYYNSSSGQLEDGGKACDVGARMRQTCTFTLYTITGGKNATDVIPFKIVGWVGDICGNGEYCAGSMEYDTTLEVTVGHYTNINEQTILDKLSTARSEYTRVSAQYTGNCYNRSGYDVLQFASTEIQRASDMLTICNIHDSLYAVNDAINRIRQAEGYAKPASCGAPPGNNNSQNNQSAPPENNNTEVPQNESFNQTYNETGNNTPGTENVTNITSALIKGCIPFCILASVLLFAVWSERKNN
jgi:hypothetical protein